MSECGTCVPECGCGTCPNDCESDNRDLEPSYWEYISPEPSTLETFAKVDCDCPKCRKMCENYPCWPTPSEAMKIMDFAPPPPDMLVLDYWERSAESNGQTVYIVAPASEEEVEEGQSFASSYRYGSCAFLAENGCLLKQLDVQPSEGAIASHNPVPELHEAVMKEWMTPLGKLAVAKFKKLRRIGMQDV